MRNIPDLHCHILPGIDDGAQDAEMARKLLQSSLDSGVDRFVFTPHFYPERMNVEEFAAKRRASFSTMLPYLQEMKIPYRLGAEVHYTPALASMPLQDLAIAGTRYLLLELFTAYEPMDVDGLISRLRKAGYTPILAHVERYPYIDANPVRLYDWVRAGALVQVNAGWYLHSKHARKKLERLFRWNLVHVMASDAHRIPERPPELGKALSSLPRSMAEQLCANAEAVFAGEEIQPPAPIKPKQFLGKWR